MSIMIIIHNSEIDKLNNLVKIYKETSYSIVLEEKDYFTISIVTKYPDDIVMDLLDDFDSVIVSEIVRKRRSKDEE